jgi:hypothetical protein
LVDPLPLGSLLGTFVDDFGVAVRGAGPGESRPCGSHRSCQSCDTRSDNLTN